MHESPPTFPASEEVVPHEEPLRSNIYTSAAALQSNVRFDQQLELISSVRIQNMKLFMTKLLI